MLSLRDCDSMNGVLQQVDIVMKYINLSVGLFDTALIRPVGHLLQEGEGLHLQDLSDTLKHNLGSLLIMVR